MSSAAVASSLKMPLSRTHPFTVPSHSFIQDGGSSLPPLKSVLKEQSPSAASTTSAAGLPDLQSGCTMITPNLIGRAIKGSTSSPSSQPQQPEQKPKTMVATPEQVMKLYMNKLTPYERYEIYNYPQIYFIGANAKKRPGIIGNAIFISLYTYTYNYEYQ